MKSTLSADNHFTYERRGMGGMGLLWPLLPPHSIMLTLSPVPVTFLTCCPACVQSQAVSMHLVPSLHSLYITLYLTSPPPPPLYRTRSCPSCPPTRPCLKPSSRRRSSRGATSARRTLQRSWDRQTYSEVRILSHIYFLVRISLYPPLYAPEHLPIWREARPHLPAHLPAYLPLTCPLTWSDRSHAASLNRHPPSLSIHPCTLAADQDPALTSGRTQLTPSTHPQITSSGTRTCGCA